MVATVGPGSPPVNAYCQMPEHVPLIVPSGCIEMGVLTRTSAPDHRAVLGLCETGDRQCR
jgi:hypothetical protein